MGTAVKGPESDRSALIIVDMQNDFLHREGSFGHQAREHPEFNIDMPFLTGTISKAKRLADAFREACRPVVYVAHVMKPDYSDAAWPYWRLGMEPGSGRRTHCVEGTWGAQIVDELKPQEGEHLVVKKGFGGFAPSTPLDTILRNMGVTTCVVTGVTTCVCVSTTVRGGVEHNYRGNTAAGIYLGAIGAVAGIVFASIWMTTQITAYRLHFHPALGTPLLTVGSPYRELLGPAAILAATLGAGGLMMPAWRSTAAMLFMLAAGLLALRVGPLYAPLNFFIWWWRFGDVRGIEELWRQGAWMVSVPSHAAVFVAIIFAVRRARRLTGPTDTHGSARWAARTDLQAAGLVGRSGGVYVGAWPDERETVYLRHDGPQHVLAFAPSRSGKGVGLVLPTLLSWPSSVVVNDIKGENWALTAGWRRDRLGNVCLKFHPTAADGSSARYNPLLEVRPWPNDVRDAQLIADMLIDPDGQGSRDHWDLTAHDLLVGTILHVLYAERQKTLQGCLALLSDPTRTIESTLTIMLKTVHDPERQYGWVDTVGHPTRTHPAVSGAARTLLNKSDNERSSVISSAVKFLNLYRDPVVARNTSTSDFAVRDLMHHDRRVSLYLTIPPSDIYRTRPLLRLLLQQIVSRLTETMDFGEAQGGPGHRSPLLLMLDEFPTLGRMDVLQTALAYLPGYGIRAYLIVQDLTQLAHAYGRYEAIISNCHVRVAFAANKVETAKLISDMVGTMTVHKETRTYTGSRLNPVLMHVMASEQETSRPLLTPDEVMRLPDDSALVFVAGHPTIYARKIRYYADPEFCTRAAVPPPTESDRLEHDWSHWTSRAFPRAFPAVPPEEAQTSLLTEPTIDGEETEEIRPHEAF